jgi:Arc/MetJ-type ribon-helix-helix transcriptional regulator
MGRKLLGNLKLTIRIDPELLERLHAAAEQEREPGRGYPDVSRCVRQAIREWLGRRPRKSRPEAH